MEKYGPQDIGKLRRRIGLTQKQLADRAGVSQSLIAKIETGKVDAAYSKVTAVLDALEAELNRAEKSKTAEEIMTPEMIKIGPGERLGKVMHIMKDKAISQLPVFDNGKPVGSLSDSMLVDWIMKHGENVGKALVKEEMEESFPTIPYNAGVELVAGMLKHYKAVLVKKGGNFVGIITRADLIKAMEK